MSFEIKNTVSSCLDDLQHTIQTGSLEHEGDEFSFTREYVTLSIRRTGWWSKYKYSPDGVAYDCLKKAIKSLPTGVSIIKQKTQFNANESGYIITFNVSREYSTSLFYSNYALEGFKFRDYLLKKHLDMLESMCSNTFLSYYDRFDQNVKKGAYVSILGVAQYYDFDYPYGFCDRIENLSFAKLGMENLKDIPHCYGLALALLEIVKIKWEKYGTIASKISEYHGVLHLEYIISPQCKQLQTW